MKCKDIPERPILEHLERFEGKWCNWYFGDERDVSHVMPAVPSRKLVLAKMRQLMKRGLVSGCDRGCRGDFEITQKGREELARLRGYPKDAYV